MAGTVHIPTYPARPGLCGERGRQEKTERELPTTRRDGKVEEQPACRGARFFEVLQLSPPTLPPPWFCHVPLLEP